jgi:hypothetical protein
MPFFRRFALLVTVAAGFAVLSSPAFASSPRDLTLPQVLDSTNFRVHYQSDHISFPTWSITETQAGDVAAMAERALALDIAAGYPRPLSDGALGGDGRIDIYVRDFFPLNNPYLTVTGFAKWDADNPTTSGFIELAGNLQKDALNQHVIAQYLFNLVQLSLWRPTQLSDYWLYVASAEWMGFRADSYPSVDPVSQLGPSDMALDCRDAVGAPGVIDPNPHSNKCNLTADYLGNGQSRWPFFEYLGETYGAAFAKDIFTLGAAGSLTAIAAVDAALQAKGTTLTAAYNAWVKTEVSSAYSPTSLSAVKPKPYGAPIYTGVVSTDQNNHPLTSQKVTANHLSTRYLEFVRGPSSGGTPASVCWKATLGISVNIPPGTLSQPVFYWDGGGGSPVPLAVNGNTATGSIPWDTCTWLSGEGFLGLPNASTTVDAADFTVTAWLVVDTTTQVTSILPATPPPPATVTGPVIPVSSADLAPTIAVFGPQVLTLSASDQEIRLIVNASGQGLLSASLGPISLGTVSLRAGNNDVRFTIPKGTLAAVRRSASPSNVLTLTPTATNGTAIGTPVTRTVSIEPTKAVKKVVVKKVPVKKTPVKKTPAKKTKSAK